MEAESRGIVSTSALATETTLGLLTAALPLSVSLSATAAAAGAIAALTLRASLAWLPATRARPAKARGPALSVPGRSR